MSIEIRELIIKATVAPAGAQAGGAGQSGGSDDNSVSPGEEMINTCVEKILEILRDKHER